MQCYYVLVHGTLQWTVAPPSDDLSQPDGFYCHRYVLAADERRAAEIAFGRVRSNLNRGGAWLSNGDALLTLRVDEIRAAPFYKLVKPDNRGHTFYEDDDGS